MLKPEIVFTDHMVLQRNKPIRIFGEANKNSKVTVCLLREKEKIEETVKAVDGRFEVILPAQKATAEKEKCYLKISDNKTEYVYKDIAIGEVWLAGGQSNMELELQNAFGGRDILDKPLSKKDVRKKLRYFYTPKIAYKGDTYEDEMRKASWMKYSKENAVAWSAVGYFFAKKIAEELDVTVGIIGCNWGGTSASCWMSTDELSKKKSTQTYLDDYDKSESSKKSVPEQIKEYLEYSKYQEEWDKKAAPIYEKEPMISWEDIQKRIGKNYYPGPMNCANFCRPAGLYETMVKRIVPYTIKGVIYYQGESDEHRPSAYYDLMSSLINNWREDFKDETLPFIMTQLPMHRYSHDPDTKSWCIIREAQMKVYHTVKNTGIAVIIDCGVFHEIHPPKKNKVGKRLALQALDFVYGKESSKNAFGPVYKDYIYKNGGIEISFDYAKDGFKVLKKKNLGFEIAGKDGKFREAKVTFTKNGVFLKSISVKNPKMARYLWSNYSEVYVFGANGLPMAPFRTHEF